MILYGEPGTGKTLLAKAVAHSTSATFLRVVGSELIQKYLGDGPKLVRELFRVADELAPSIVFIGVLLEPYPTLPYTCCDIWGHVLVHAQNAVLEGCGAAIERAACRDAQEWVSIATVLACPGHGVPCHSGRCTEPQGAALVRNHAAVR